MHKLYLVTFLAIFLSKSLLNGALAKEPSTQDSTQTSSTVTNWTGFYFGINSGYIFGNSHAKTSATTPPTNQYLTNADVVAVDNDGDMHLYPQGYIGGGQVGFNKCFKPGITLGVETDFNAFLLHKSKSASSLYPEAGTGQYTIIQKVSTDWLYTLRPRAGYAYKNLLAFVTGGLSLTNFKYNQRFFDNSLSAQGYSSSLDANVSATTNKSCVGWNIGAGVEYLLISRFSISLCYLYTSFNSLSNSENIRLDLLDTIYTSSLYNTANLNANIIRLAINWRL